MASLSKTPEPQQEASERTISAAPLAEREVTVDKGYIGYVTPINDVSVRPYISGFIDDIRVKGGSEVKSGDVLLVINQAEYKAQLDAASASVAQAQATYNNSDVYYQRIQKRERGRFPRPKSTMPKLLTYRRRPLCLRPKRPVCRPKSITIIRL